MTELTKNKNIEELLKVGAHFGFGRSRRHPASVDFLLGSKNRVDIFDLEKTKEALDKALAFVASIASNNGVILFIGGKNEAQNIIKNLVPKINMPYVASRWIGGTLTNFPEIRKRVESMLDLLKQKEKGELAKYTKKERILIDRKIEKLQKMFWGIKDLSALPKALFIVDPRYEHTAVKEAKALKIPIIALCGSDNNMKDVDYPIPGNDSSMTSIEYFVKKVTEEYHRNQTKSEKA